MLPEAAAGAACDAFLAPLKHGFHRTSRGRCREVPAPLPMRAVGFLICLCKSALNFQR